MKKITLLLLPLLIIIAACGSQPESSASVGDSSGLESQLAEKDSVIADLKEQVAQLTEQYGLLQEDYDALLVGGQASSAAGGSPFMCESVIENMKYQNPASAVAILEGWFALQPQVQQLEGSFSSLFWQGVNSRIHTIRYIDADSGLSETENFMIFFEEAGWRPGLLDMNNQCWLDYPD